MSTKPGRPGACMAYAIIRSPSAANTGMGCNLLPGGAGASFRVWAPKAAGVDVLLRRNNDDAYVPLALARDGAGADYWSADVSGVRDGEEYRFRMSLGPGRTTEHVDPYARSEEHTSELQSHHDLV